MKVTKRDFLTIAVIGVVIVLLIMSIIREKRTETRIKAISQGEG